MSRKHRWNEAADERSETEVEPSPESFDEEKSRSRMAREAKIGLAVIFVLLVVFVVVLYDRLTSADENAQAAEAASAQTEPPESPAPDQFEPADHPPRSGEPDVLTARMGSDGAIASAPPPSLDWRGVAVEDNQPGEGSAGRIVPSSPSSVTPDAGSATFADRYSSYPSAPTADAATEAWPSGHGRSVESPDYRQPHGVFQSPPVQAVGDDTPAGLSEVDTLAGPQLPVAEVGLAPYPNSTQTGTADQLSSQPQNPLRGQTVLVDPTASAQPRPYSDQGGSAYQAWESSHESAPRAPAPIPAADPRSTFRTTAQASDLTRQADTSSVSYGRDSVGQQYPSYGASTAQDTGLGWVSGQDAAQSDLTQPSLSRDTPNLGNTARQFAGGSSVGQPATYVVQPNDSYWSISKKLYGTGAYFRALAHHNRSKVPDADHLGVGDEILAPHVSELEKAYPDLCPTPAHREAAQRRALLGGTQGRTGSGRIYVVQEGDNLFDIARYQLGKATRWTDIVNLNQELLGPSLDDLNYLTPGMKLVLPDNQPAGNLSERPNALYQR